MFIDNSASEVFATISALAESPVKRGLIWAGTDDGNLQVSTNGGGQWTNIASRLPGVPAGSPFSCVELSHASESVAYVALDRHMFDDFRPYIYKTNDGGQTWKSASNGLPPMAFVWVIREDPKNPSLLYAGTEVGLYASFDAGESWAPLHLKNLPWSIAVRDIVVHEPENDLIIATHGRSLWVLDDLTPLQQLTSGATLFPIRAAVRHAVKATRFGFGDKTFRGPSPPYGALITYQLAEPAKEARLVVVDASNPASTREMACPKEAGMHRVAWDLRFGARALPGKYTARLIVDGKSYEQPFSVMLDPSLQVRMEDLRAQSEASREIAAMRASVSATVAQLNSARAGDPNAAALLDKLVRPRGQGRSETGPRLLDRLDALAALVDAADAAPTPAMLRYLGELKAEYQEAMAASAALPQAGHNVVTPQL